MHELMVLKNSNSVAKITFAISANVLSTSLLTTASRSFKIIFILRKSKIRVKMNAWV